MSQIVEEIRRELIANSDEQLQKSNQRFFKEYIQGYGMKNATVVKITKEFFKLIKDKPKAEIFNLCDELLQSGMIEESFVACNWSYYIYKKYTTDDLMVFEKWIDSYVNNWASCDGMCNHTVGKLVEMYPETISELKRWATSSNRWMKRASAVSLIVPARHGLFLNDIFQIADILMMDREDMVQKGYGWMLKAASQAHERDIFEYVMSKKTVMPRTALRYAIEKMPAELKAKAMDKNN